MTFSSLERIPLLSQNFFNRGSFQQRPIEQHDNDARAKTDNIVQKPLFELATSSKKRDASELDSRLQQPDTQYVLLVFTAADVDLELASCEAERRIGNTEGKIEYFTKEEKDNIINDAKTGKSIQSKADKKSKWSFDTNMRFLVLIRAGIQLRVIQKYLGRDQEISSPYREAVAKNLSIIYKKFFKEIICSNMPACNIASLLNSKYYNGESCVTRNDCELIINLFRDNVTRLLL